MGSLLGLGLMLSLGVTMSLGIGVGRRSVVVELGVGVWERLLVRVHREAVVPRWGARRGRWEVLLVGGVLLGHDDVMEVGLRW